MTGVIHSATAVRAASPSAQPDPREDERGRGLHELRRTFATRLRDRGVPLEDVQRLGRWSSPQVLLELYSASDEQRLRRAAENAADAIDAD